MFVKVEQDPDYHVIKNTVLVSSLVLQFFHIVQLHPENQFYRVHNYLY